MGQQWDNERTTNEQQQKIHGDKSEVRVRQEFISVCRAESNRGVAAGCRPCSANRC